MLLSFIPARMRSVPDRAVVIMFNPVNHQQLLPNPMGFRPPNLHGLLSWCCGPSRADSCPLGERLACPCSHCATVLHLGLFLAGNPAFFETTHREVQLLDRGAPVPRNLETAFEVL